MDLCGKAITTRDEPPLILRHLRARLAVRFLDVLRHAVVSHWGFPLMSLDGAEFK